MDVKLLRMLALAWIPVVVALVAVAWVIDASDGWPVLGSVLAAVAGLFALMAIGWLRQRPIAPGDGGSYGTTVLIKLAFVEAVGLIGFVLAIAAGPWWLAVIGAGFSLACLCLAWPSAADRERHELLYLV